MKKQKIYRIGLEGMLLALAFVLSYVEVLLPFSFGVPGIKLGLPNLITVMGLYLLGTPATIQISLLRILLVTASFGNAQTLIYSLMGWLFSMMGMLVLKRMQLSVCNISAAGGVLHNLGQLSAAVLLLKSPVLFLYLPVLVFAGVISGAIIGMLGGIITVRVKEYLSHRA